MLRELNLVMTPETVSARPALSPSAKFESGEPADEILSVATYFCRSAKMRIDHHFAGTSQNADRAATISRRS